MARLRSDQLYIVYRTSVRYVIFLKSSWIDSKMQKKLTSKRVVIRHYTTIAITVDDVVSPP